MTANKHAAQPAILSSAAVRAAREDTDQAVEEALHMLMDSSIAERAIGNIGACIERERTALASPGGSINEWTKNPPNPLAAYRCRWWWVKYVLPNGKVSWCEPRNLGAPLDYVTYCSRNPSRGHFEFRPCRLEDEAPAAPVQEVQGVKQNKAASLAPQWIECPECGGKNSRCGCTTCCGSGHILQRGEGDG